MHRAALASAAAAAMVFAAPCRAADDFQPSPAGVAPPAAFAGAVVRLGLDRRNRLQPSARLRLGVSRVRDNSPETGRERNTGLELGFARTGRADFYVGGRSMSQIESRLGLGGSGSNTIAIVFGVALVVVGVVVIAGLNDLDLESPLPPAPQ